MSKLREIVASAHRPLWEKSAAVVPGRVAAAIRKTMTATPKEVAALSPQQANRLLAKVPMRPITAVDKTDIMEWISRAGWTGFL